MKGSQINKIFISHSTKDREFVIRLASDLVEFGIDIWYSEWEIKLGDSLHDKIEEGISSSGWLAVVLSKNSVASRWVRKELNVALVNELHSGHVFVLPILIDDCSIPVFLRDKLYADFRTKYKYGFDSVLKRLELEVDGNSTPHKMILDKENMLGRTEYGEVVFTSMEYVIYSWFCSRAINNQPPLELSVQGKDNDLITELLQEMQQLPDSKQTGHYKSMLAKHGLFREFILPSNI